MAKIPVSEKEQRTTVNEKGTGECKKLGQSEAQGNGGQAVTIAENLGCEHSIEKGKKIEKNKTLQERGKAQSQAPSLTSCSSSGFLGGCSRRLGGKGLTPAESRGVLPTPLTISPGSSEWWSGEKGKYVSIYPALSLTLALSPSSSSQTFTLAQYRHPAPRPPGRLFSLQHLTF